MAKIHLDQVHAIVEDDLEVETFEKFTQKDDYFIEDEPVKEDFKALRKLKQLNKYGDHDD